MAKDAEKRKEEALDYFVREFYESRVREEKLESYSRIRRWVYRISRDLKDAGMIFKEIIVKPVGMTLFIMSGWFSVIIAISVAPKIVTFIGSIVPFPYNLMIDVIIAFPIPFSPMIIAEGLYICREKKRIEKRLREDYGIEV